MVDSNQKRFKAYWGSGYVKTGSKIKPLSFFNINKGYDENVIYQLDMLKVGQRLDLTDLSGTHTITRIK